MEAVSAGEPRRFDHLREHSIGLWQGPPVLGVLLTIWLVRARPEKLKDMDRVYVADETFAPGAAPAFIPEA